jgi:hypothetical protein
MTTPTPTPSLGISMGRALSTPRALVAWAIIGYPALFLFFEFFELILPGGSFAGRAAGAEFRSLTINAIPVLAVVLAAYVGPPIPAARLLARIALIEYAVTLIFGSLTLVVGLVAVVDGVNSAQSGLGAMRYVVMGATELGMIAVVASVALRAYTGLGGKLPVSIRIRTTS